MKHIPSVVKFVAAMIQLVVILVRVARVWCQEDNYYWPTSTYIPIYVDYYEPYKEDPNLWCPENAEWTECVPPCPWTCQRIKEYQFFADFVCPGFCRAGCKCKYGYVLTEDYRCVSFLTCFY